MKKAYWCLHCERAYFAGEFKFDEYLDLMCPYPECDGSIMLDRWDWVEIRAANPGYPKIPEKGVRYPLYG